MQAEPKNHARLPFWLMHAILALAVGLSGCHALCVPSARQLEPSAIGTNSSTGGHAVSGSLEYTSGLPLAGGTVVPPAGLPAVLEGPTQPVPPDLACSAPLPGYCGADECPPLLPFARCGWRQSLGPLFPGGAAQGDQLAEAELYPPHSKFHPVPTQPVFAPRVEYTPPQRMMEPVKRFPHHPPAPLPALIDGQPIEADPEMETAPAPAAILAPPMNTTDDASLGRVGDARDEPSSTVRSVLVR